MAGAAAGRQKLAITAIPGNKLAVPYAFGVDAIPDRRPAVFQNIAHFLFEP